jgi:hypothetical protein
MRGATWSVSQLTEAQRKTMRAMVDLDNLGRTPAVFALGTVRQPARDSIHSLEAIVAAVFNL